jgi:hypothetical protein
LADRPGLHALGAATKLREEGQCDAAIPSYDAHFARMDVGPMETAAVGEAPEALPNVLARFDAMYDEPVLRAVATEEALDAYLTVLRAAASG